MISLSYDGGLDGITFDIMINRLSDGKYEIVRSTKFGESNFVVYGAHAEELELIIENIPGPGGADDIENMIYDGATLSLRWDNSNSRTRIGLSLPHRKVALEWMEHFNQYLMKLKTERDSGDNVG